MTASTTPRMPLSAAAPARPLSSAVTPACDRLPTSTALFDAQFGRWLERRLQRWTEVAVAQGEARWAREGGLRSRYY